MELFTSKKKGEQQGSQNSLPDLQGGGNQSGNQKQGSGKQSQSGFSQNDVLKDMNTLARRTRINEERSMNIRKKLQMIEHNMLTHQKKMVSEIRYLNEEITDLKRSIEELKSNMSGLSKEFQDAAKKEDVQVLERYINLWEPVNFITRKEVERIIDEKLGRE